MAEQFRDFYLKVGAGRPRPYQVSVPRTAWLRFLPPDRWGYRPTCQVCFSAANGLLVISTTPP
jgi:hypothetical protein